MNRYIYCLVAVIVVGGLPFVTFASNVGIAVNQTSIVFDANVNESQEFVIEVRNIFQEQRVIEIDVVDYILDDENVMTLLNENDEDSGMKDWISSEEKNIVLKPGEERDVVFTVEVPENISIGSHRGVVLFRGALNDDDTVKVRGQIGVHILANIRGDTHANGDISKFDIPLLATDFVEYSVEFENMGNVHYVPYGEIAIRNVFTKNIQVYEYEKHFVFPGKKFTFVKIEKIPSLFGLYKARVTFVDGEGVTRTKSDYMMGYFFPLVFIVVAGVVVYLLRYILKNKRKKS